MNLHDALYQCSIEEIEFDVECLEYFKSMRRKYKYCGLFTLWDDLYNVTKNKLNKVLKEHEQEFDEDVDISIIKDKLNNIGMRYNKAIEIIKRIDKSLCRVSEYERSFMCQMIDKRQNLSIKQANWLMDIYRRI